MGDLIATVNANDEIVDYQDKMEVHLKGLLHRAFSIFVFNSKAELMLHKRALEKYHSPGLWTNTCCSHLTPSTDMESIVHQRLMDEMGFDTDLQYLTKFHYRIDFSNGLTENEVDHIYIGIFNEKPSPNPMEVADVKWMSLSDLKNQIEQNPDNFTYWLKYIIQNHYEDLTRGLNKILTEKR